MISSTFTYINKRFLLFYLFGGKFNMPNLINVPGIENTTEEFRNKVVKIADNLKMDPNFMMAIMSFESGATFSPKVKNSQSGATGLIQFMSATAKGLGTTIEKLAKMSAVDQLDFVEKHFLPFKGKLKTIEDAYMAVLLPKGVGKGKDFVLFKKGTKAYSQNSGLDLNGDGEITVAEAASKVSARLGTPSVNKIVELKKGDNGAAVESLQDEMIDLGYMTLEQKKTGVGIFGPKTEGFLKVFQKDVLLKDNGIYDLPTQAAVAQINQRVKKGSTGGVVQAVQERLVKTGFLTQDQMNTGIGIFGPKSQAALIQFQIKNELEPNGILTDETFRLLFKAPAPVTSVKPNGTNKDIDSVLPMSGEGFRTYNREPQGADQFGTQLTVNALIALAKAWFLIHPEVPIQFGDMSRRFGGKFPPHKSHQSGRDADVRPIRKDNQMAAITMTEAQYDSKRTEEFVRLVLKMFPGATIFFNDPKIVSKGLTKPLGGHHNHLHIRLP
jgi:peptidoglycan hydrolase-like protein with peptidoglycan-binding domain